MSLLSAMFIETKVCYRFLHVGKRSLGSRQDSSDYDFDSLGTPKRVVGLSPWPNVTYHSQPS